MFATNETIATNIGADYHLSKQGGFMISGTFYTKTEVSEILGCDMKTLYRWMKAGKVKYEKLGSASLIPESEVKRLQDERGSRVLVQNG